MNTRFGKLIDNRIEFAPSIIVDGDKSISTNDPVVMLRYGYKQIVREPYPQGEIAYTKHYVRCVQSQIWKEHIVIKILTTPPRKLLL